MRYHYENVNVIYKNNLLFIQKQIEMKFFVLKKLKFVNLIIMNVDNREIDIFKKNDNDNDDNINDIIKKND